MEITKMQVEIEILRSRLTIETEKYRQAIKADKVLSKVKPLYKKVKATMCELQKKMSEYEKLLNNEMENFDRHKHQLPPQ